MRLCSELWLVLTFHKVSLIFVPIHPQILYKCKLWNVYMYIYSPIKHHKRHFLSLMFSRMVQYQCNGLSGPEDWATFFVQWWKSLCCHPVVWFCNVLPHHLFLLGNFGRKAHSFLFENKFIRIKFQNYVLIFLTFKFVLILGGILESDGWICAIRLKLEKDKGSESANNNLSLVQTWCRLALSNQIRP